MVSVVMKKMVNWCVLNRESDKILSIKRKTLADSV